MAAGAGILLAAVLGMVVLPTRGSAARMATLYDDAHGRTTMEYDLGRSVDDKVYSTDGHPLFAIDQAEASMLANTPFQPSTFSFCLRPAASRSTVP